MFLEATSQSFSLGPTRDICANGVCRTSKTKPNFLLFASIQTGHHMVGLRHIIIFS